MRPPLLKQLDEAGIHDGLLRDFISRGLIEAIPAEIETAIAEREKQIEVLRSLLNIDQSVMTGYCCK